MLQLKMANFASLVEFLLFMGQLCFFVLFLNHFVTISMVHSKRTNCGYSDMALDFCNWVAGW